MLVKKPGMIRKMENNDFDRVEQIWYQESVRVHNWMEGPDKFWDRNRQGLRDIIKKSDVKLVYDQDDIVRGFVLFGYINPNYIAEIFVDHQQRTYPDGKSREIGKALIDYLKASNPCLTVSVYMLNHKAIKFYIKNDFVITTLYAEQGTGFTKLFMQWERIVPQKAIV